MLEGLVEYTISDFDKNDIKVLWSHCSF